MRTENKLLLIAPVLAVALSGCASVKSELGVGRNSPDEFMVIKRAPLTLPPEYTLRPPVAPNKSKSAEETAEKTRAALMGKTKTSSAAKGAAEKALLDKIGVETANTDIRKMIDDDNGYISIENRTVADKLIFWDDEQHSPNNIPASVVDPKAETKRLKKNQKEGKPVNTGIVPVIEKKKSTLDRIF
ncbi:MAG: DUF3035 domain-containing protein [Alphaproteobacteria bacterium]|nr:DUF3035 domain-containing protein [Alphaproteobacteria bacterium]